MIKRATTALLAASMLVPAGCGFEPVHRPSLTGQSSNVDIEQIEGRTGHALRKALLQETASGIPGKDYASISVRLSESLERIGFSSDGVATRSAFTLRAQYVVDFGDDAVSGVETAVVYYSVPPSPYGDISAQNDAAETAAGVLARRITDDITLQVSER